MAPASTGRWCCTSCIASTSAAWRTAWSTSSTTCPRIAFSHHILALTEVSSIARADHRRQHRCRAPLGKARGQGPARLLAAVSHHPPARPHRGAHPQHRHPGLPGACHGWPGSGAGCTASTAGTCTTPMAAIPSTGVGERRCSSPWCTGWSRCPGTWSATCWIWTRAYGPRITRICNGVDLANASPPSRTYRDPVKLLVYGSVTRFSDIKAPLNTIRAFAGVRRRGPPASW